jgi:hypothetical protein
MVPGHAVLLVVGLPAAGLGEPAAEQVTHRQDHDVRRTQRITRAALRSRRASAEVQGIAG